MRKSVSFCGLKIALGLLLLLSGIALDGISPLYAQEEVAPEGEGAALASDEPFFRFSAITEMSAVRFNDPHPYKQMTGFNKFDDTMAKPQTGFESRKRVNNQKDSGAIQSFIRALPPFSIEFVIPVDFIISGASIEYYHTSTLHLDTEVVANNAKPKHKIPVIEMRTYYDFLSVSAHMFDPGEEGYDLFFGLGLAKISGAYEGGFRGRAENNYIRTVKTANFNAFPISFRKVGLDVIGDIWTFRFATFLFSRAEVITNNVFVGNELTPDAKKTIHFDGLFLRAALMFRCKYALCFF